MDVPQRTFYLDDGIPRVYPIESFYKKIYQHFGDPTPNGDNFWYGFFRSKVYEELYARWEIDGFEENGIDFDPDEMIVDGLKVTILISTGDSYAASAWISTPELNAVLKKAVAKAKNREYAYTKKELAAKQKSGAIVSAQKEDRHRPGCSNMGKYPDVPEEFFCGPSGGSCAGTFPVNTPGRWRAAKARAHFAPDPQGIKDCADRIAIEQGWKKK